MQDRRLGGSSLFICVNLSIFFTMYIFSPFNSTLSHSQVVGGAWAHPASPRFATDCSCLEAGWVLHEFWYLLSYSFHLCCVFLPQKPPTVLCDGMKQSSIHAQSKIIEVQLVPWFKPYLFYGKGPSSLSISYESRISFVFLVCYRYEAWFAILV